MVLYEVKASANAFLELLFLEDEMVGRSHHNRRIGVYGADMVGCPGNARSGVAAGRFQKYMLWVEQRQLLADEVGIHFVGHHHNVVGVEG